VDKYWIDNVNVRVTGWTGSLGRGLTQLQNGQTQAYALAIAAGILVTIAAFLIWGA
jgi:hypothetical protein